MAIFLDGETTKPVTPKSGGGLSPGATAGIIAGCVLFVVIAAVACAAGYIVYNQRQKEKKKNRPRRRRGPVVPTRTNFVGSRNPRSDCPSCGGMDPPAAWPAREELPPHQHHQHHSPHSGYPTQHPVHSSYVSHDSHHYPSSYISSAY